jgi:predicted kinase
MLIGIPGCGKSTTVAKLKSESPNAVVVCPDDLREKFTGDAGNQDANRRIFTQVVPKMFRDAFINGQDIIYDATNYNRKNRKDALKFAKTNGYEIIGYQFTTPVEVCRERNAKRSRVVPDFVYDRMTAGWQDPSADEGFSEIHKINNA